MSRSSGPLQLTPAFVAGVRRLLAWRTYRAEGVLTFEARAEMPLLTVTDVEEVLGTRMHDELVALVVLGLPKGSRLADLPDLRTQARKKGLPSAWLAFAPNGEFVTPLRPDLKEGMRIAAWKATDSTVEMAFAAPRWLERWLDQSMAEVDVPAEMVTTIQATGEGPLEIVLTEAPAPEPVAPSRVRHAKFGMGTVVGQADGKVEVAFDDGQKRTLLERFIERL